MSDRSFDGAIGTVVRPVRGGRVPGEIRVVLAGEPQFLLAYCAEELPVDTRVCVVSSRGSRQVDVERWPRRR
jgi:membrane protein implicated in regulation of membrane protease activity